MSFFPPRSASNYPRLSAILTELSIDKDQATEADFNRSPFGTFGVGLMNCTLIRFWGEDNQRAARQLFPPNASKAHPPNMFHVERL
jgi:hypothetical protein